MKSTANKLTAADLSAIAGNLSAATGGAAPHHALRLMRELAGAASPGGAEAEAAADPAGESGESPVVAALEAAIALAPRDPLEGMLAAQMTAVHAAAMRCLGRAAECKEHPQIEALYLREASRLLHLFVRQAEALDRRAKRLGPPQATEDTIPARKASEGREDRGSGDGKPPVPGSRPPASDSPGPGDRAAARRVGRKIAAIFAGGETDGDAAAASPAAATKPDPNDLANFLADLHARERERRGAETRQKGEGEDVDQGTDVRGSRRMNAGPPPK